MKSGTLVAILLLQTVVVMGILAHSQAADADDDFPKCCDHCNSWSGAQFCDDVGPRCRDGCVNCRVVQTRPVKTFRSGVEMDAPPSRTFPARRRAKTTDRSTSSHGFGRDITEFGRRPLFNMFGQVFETSSSFNY
ncbi:uncharacterized protein [Triticum aestivum]|uniref:uncharacterized protein n=1 Tax=Triticum aestivum TaxID=4565 RepID=UPI001D02518C|nr:uncharacterized protein LOC123101707 [Triticum aestivum]